MTTHAEHARPQTDDLAALASEAFLYGFPLVYDLAEIERFTRVGMGSLAPAPLNVFSHATGLAGPKDTFVSVNNDTVYSIANVDVSGGPVRLDVPDSAGRYYVLQFVDAWTNNFAYVGRRATGTGPKSMLLVGPDWDDDARDVIRFPTAIATIVGRWAVDGEADLPAVARLQQRLTLTPGAPGAGVPAPKADVADDVLFFERLRVWAQAFPPAARDRARQRRFEPLGLLAAQSPYTDAGSELVTALRAGLEAGRQRMEHALEHSDIPQQNGWSLSYHAFDYNLDFFEVGTLDEDRWKLADDANRYLTRALSARGGLWGNHGYEAAYAMAYVDGDGEPLDGAQHYELRFPTPPPVGAFWSVTMYDTPDFYLIENPIDRYSIGDRTDGIRYDEDGSLTIVIQRDEPSDRANWLPAPAGRFRPILRLYSPDEAIFDGTYELPPITRVRPRSQG